MSEKSCDTLRLDMFLMFSSVVRTAPARLPRPGLFFAKRRYFFTTTDKTQHHKVLDITR